MDYTHMHTQSRASVAAWEQNISLPTYPVPAPDKNPMFLDKRVYQGSSGRVYPNPITDRLSDHKIDKSYKALFLENAWLRVMILPELGGRIHIAQDNTNGYAFFYQQHVIKPALVAGSAPGSQAASNSIGPSTIAPPPLCPSTISLKSTATAARPSGSANTSS